MDFVGGPKNQPKIPIPQKMMEKSPTKQTTSWWLNQPISKILVKLDHLPR